MHVSALILERWLIISFIIIATDVKFNLRVCLDMHCIWRHTDSCYHPAIPNYKHLWIEIDSKWPQCGYFRLCCTFANPFGVMYWKGTGPACWDTDCNSCGGDSCITSHACGGGDLCIWGRKQLCGKDLVATDAELEELVKICCHDLKFTANCIANSSV